METIEKIININPLKLDQCEQAKTEKGTNTKKIHRSSSKKLNDMEN